MREKRVCLGWVRRILRLENLENKVFDWLVVCLKDKSVDWKRLWRRSLVFILKREEVLSMRVMWLYLYFLWDDSGVVGFLWRVERGGRFNILRKFLYLFRGKDMGLKVIGFFFFFSLGRILEK